MKKLYYIKCRYGGETWTCDVTDSILEANKLLKEHQEDDRHSKFRISNTPGPEGVEESWFNKERVKKFILNKLQQE